MKKYAFLFGFSLVVGSFIYLRRDHFIKQATLNAPQILNIVKDQLQGGQGKQVKDPEVVKKFLDDARGKLADMHRDLDSSRDKVKRLKAALKVLSATPGQNKSTLDNLRKKLAEEEKRVAGLEDLQVTAVKNVEDLEVEAKIAEKAATANQDPLHFNGLK